MISVRKSPNMMSTTGRMPVIAAPSAIPVMPGSEIGESITRSGPNSSTRPESTLNGVPASATSSPSTYTVGSRSSSSRSASFTAWDCAITRVPAGASVSSVDIFGHLALGRERRVERVLHAGGDLFLGGARDVLQLGWIREPTVDEPRAEPRDRIAVRLPVGLLFLRAVVGAVDVADMVAVKAIRVGDDERRAAAAATARHRPPEHLTDREHVLTVDLFARNPECRGARHDVARRRLRVVRVLVVLVVLAKVDDGQLRAAVEVVRGLLEGADPHHLAVHPNRDVVFDAQRPLGGRRHAQLTFLSPASCARTSKTIAKSYSSSPSPRAAVRSSFETAVVGMGTSSLRPA